MAVLPLSGGFDVWIKEDKSQMADFVLAWKGGYM